MIKVYIQNSSRRRRLLAAQAMKIAEACGEGYAVRTEITGQTSHKKRRRLLKFAFFRFWLAKPISLVLLAILLTACNSYSENPVAVVDEPTSTEVPASPTPTSTPTQEPTPTQVVEYPSPDQEWLLNVIFPKVREAGCEPEYASSYDAFDTYVNSIVWTVDEAGNPVQGLTELNFCGSNEVAEGESNTYIGFFRIGDGAPQELVDLWIERGNNFGPTYGIRIIGLIFLDPNAPPEYRVPVNFPVEYVGFLADAATLGKMQQQYICMGEGAWMQQEIYPEVYALTSRIVAEALGVNASIWVARLQPEQCQQ